ncbi:hypothetical protein [Nocardioides sp. AE5]|uniref:hypothetical protein n=1 Tax=Nocardioides sp. AE5 TaxID=2962573 RepID=UPI00288299E9|nr:hypothetical protein [Nocardioides sp. AE5]MDT0202646.1 hypothetical protein [Nocardioides sp. AE5]
MAILTRAGELPARDAAVVVTGTVRAASPDTAGPLAASPGTAGPLLDQSLTWPHKSARLAALQLLPARGEELRAQTLAASTRMPQSGPGAEA